MAPVHAAILNLPDCCWNTIISEVQTIVHIMQFFTHCVLFWHWIIRLQKHSGIIGEFRRRYIKTGIFPVEMSEMHQ